MLNDLTQVTTEQIRTFLTGMAAGYFTVQKTDDGNIVFHRRQFDPNTGIEIDGIVVATLTKAQFLQDIADCQFRIDSINQFIATQNL